VVSLTELQEIPSRNMVLLVGPPGAGKSTFCQETVLKSITMGPVVYVTTESTPSQIIESLRQKGLGEELPHALGFIDAFRETVGLPSIVRSDAIDASCGDLTSLSIAITKMRERIDENALLVFDSLTSPYLMNGSEVLSFIRTTLLKFAVEGNAVLACIDEGCGKPEDLVAMMSLSNGVIKLEREDGRRVLNVVKHPVVEPTRVEAPGAKIPEKLWFMKMFNEEIVEYAVQTIKGEASPRIRRELGNDVNLFWLNFVHWSEILWDPKGFPEMAYEMAKVHGEGGKEIMEVAPWHQRLLSQLLMPKSFSRVKDVKKLYKGFQKMLESAHFGAMEYVEDISKTDEHYLRVYDSFDCCGFENVGAPMAYWSPPNIAGAVKGLESWRGLERDWNAIETKCIGLGDPYCEFKLVPGEIPELKDSLEKDSQVIDRVHDRLMGRLMGFLLDGKPLVERPSGSDVSVAVVTDVMNRPAWAGERYRTVMRMAGAKAGKEVGEHLIEAGISEDEAVKRVLNLLEYCKVGKVTVDETIRMKESCESVFYGFMTKKRAEPSCYFTTGFLNGFFSAVKNQHVKETKCIAMGDPYCEWEFR
jgi:predicted hydrocarbon binding protein/KaiC/GvpD/RAD55 family RecA-like ATPase